MRRTRGAAPQGEPGGRGRIDVLSTDTETGPIYGPAPDDVVTGTLPRLARHQISLADGHKVGVSVCGRGVPIVLIHGFTAEGMLYAQCLSRIVSAGFKVVAIDSASHGSTQGLPTGGADFEEYSKLLGRVVDELGIKKAIFAGHSMGGRLITELAARQPERALAVILLDAIVGEPWDKIVAVSRFNPLLLAGVGAILLADSVSTVPFLRDPRQALKFGRLVAPTLLSHARHPTHLAGPGISILRSRSSKWMLEKLKRERVPVVAIHGDRDIVVPLSTARSAARLAGGMVVVVEGGTHSWLLKDPETLPAILRQMFDHPDSVAARNRDFAELGLAPDATIDEIEDAFYDEGAVVLDLTPEIDLDAIEPGRRTPRYRWHVDRPR
ncbi:MAG TPA: alpha/beta hydrolase [Aquihabitans sp.]|jgi:pimeloyl-ACP methyl ester carboxylesterase|nr:alpha/beta hydrolase [Aquihabitans sp.]